MGGILDPQARLLLQAAPRLGKRRDAGDLHTASWGGLVKVGDGNQQQTGVDLSRAGGQRPGQHRRHWTQTTVESQLADSPQALEGGGLLPVGGQQTDRDG